MSRSWGRVATSEVLLTQADGVGRITLNRPAAMNAITVALGRELEQAVRRLGDDARVIVIRGAGGNFCVGGDFHELERLRGVDGGALAELFDNFRAACEAVREIPVPVVAAVEGNAMAGGFELMQACDIVIVAEDARLADNHSNFGQVPGGGGSQRLPRIVGRQRALAHILTGDRLTGAEAAAWGVAYRAVPAHALETTVDELAAKLAGKPPAALRRIKRVVDAGLERSLADGLALERATVLEHLRDPAAAEGIEAFKARA
jgi:enoyl-CoA hydratase/carnithine racemase